MNKLINLLLLTVMFFSVAHGVVLEDDFSKHCNVAEYIDEFDHPTTHHDDHDSELCESHFMFHISFLLPDRLTPLEAYSFNSPIDYKLHLNDVTHQNNTFRPPIA